MDGRLNLIACVVAIWLLGCSDNTGKEFAARPPASGSSVSGNLANDDETQVVRLTRALTDDPIISIKVHDDQVDVLTQHNKVFGFERRNGTWENVASGKWVE